MMHSYLYDGTFKSLLDLISKLIKLKTKPLDIKEKENFRPNILDDVIELELNMDFDISKIKVSKNIMKTIYYVYLSNDEHKELIIYYFLLNALKYQDKIFNIAVANIIYFVLRYNPDASLKDHIGCIEIEK